MRRRGVARGAETCRGARSLMRSVVVMALLTLMAFGCGGAEAGTEGRGDPHVPGVPESPVEGGWSPAEMLAPGQRAVAGFEILDRREDGTIEVWMTVAITEEQFGALQLPPNWFKNQPRGGGGPDDGRFYGSPGSADASMVIAEHFGYEWAHVATIVQVGVPVDGEGLLFGNLIAKEHEVTYDAGTTVPVLVSPEGEVYPLVSRDARRSTDEAPIPSGWKIVNHTFTEDFTTRLPNPTLNIRTQNQDSYQGPVSGLKVSS